MAGPDKADVGLVELCRVAAIQLNVCSRFPPTAKGLLATESDLYAWHEHDRIAFSLPTTRDCVGRTHIFTYQVIPHTHNQTGTKNPATIYTRTFSRINEVLFNTDYFYEVPVPFFASAKFQLKTQCFGGADEYNLVVLMGPGSEFCGGWIQLYESSGDSVPRTKFSNDSCGPSGC